MILSKTGRYALRAAIYLARQNGEECVRVDEIAEALDVPRNYLSKILHLEARAGMLESERGPRGGFRLAWSADSLTLADMLEAVDPLSIQPTCLLGREECSDERPCAAHEGWHELSARITDFLAKTTIADLARHSDLEGALTQTHRHDRRK